MLLLCAAGLVGAIAITGGWTSSIFGFPISAKGLYTPVLIMSALAFLRAAWHLRASPKPGAKADAMRLALLTGAAGLVAAAVLSPVLYAVGERITAGEFRSPGVMWRSSPGGVDLLALVLPNPHHPLAPRVIAAWLTTFQGGFHEAVVSIPFVAIVILVLQAVD